MDMDVVVSLKYGDFSERDPLIEVPEPSFLFFDIYNHLIDRIKR